MVETRSKISKIQAPSRAPNPRTVVLKSGKYFALTLIPVTSILETSTLVRNTIAKGSGVRLNVPGRISTRNIQLRK